MWQTKVQAEGQVQGQVSAGLFNPGYGCCLEQGSADSSHSSCLPLFKRPVLRSAPQAVALEGPLPLALLLWPLPAYISCVSGHVTCSLLRFFEASGAHNFPKKER